MLWFRTLLDFLLLCFCNRERGSHHDWLGTQGARALFWATPATMVIHGAVRYTEHSLPLLAYGAVWLSLWLGYVLLPHGVGQDLNVPWTTPDSATGMDRIARPERLGYLWLAGMGRLSFVAVALSPWLTAPPLWAVLGGLGVPAGYFLGLYMPALKWRLTTKQEWGEFWSGGPYAIAFLLLFQNV